MKAIRILTGLIIMMALFGVGVHNAQAFAFSYTTGFQVQNIDPVNDATVTINFYAPDGTSPVGSTITGDVILKGSSKTYFPLTGLPSGFTGSVVVSSSTKVASVVNILGTGAANAAAAYVGAMTGSSPIQIPVLMAGNGSFNTWFSVQNTGGAATDINVTYSDGTTNSKTGVAPGAAVVFDQSKETHGAKVFSAVVTSPTGVPLAAAVVEEDPKTLFAYSGFTDGSTNPVFPLINANNAGNITGVGIMNIGSAPTTVTVTYVPSDSSSQVQCTETQTIANGSTAAFAILSFGGGTLPAGGSTTCVANQKMVGSASVTTNSASQKLVAIVNQLKPGVSGEAYNAFDPNLATTQVVLPLIMDRNSNWWTGISVMNVGTAAPVNCAFTNNAYTAGTGTGNLAANSSFVDLEINKLAAGYVGSATCTAGTGGKLVATVNEINTVTAGDNLLVYEGITP